MLEPFIEQWRENRLENYRRMPADIRAHVGIETTALAGGYGYRQILELVQNGADAILEAAEAATPGSAGASDRPPRIQVLFGGARLRCSSPTCSASWPARTRWPREGRSGKDARSPCRCRALADGVWVPGNSGRKPRPGSAEPRIPFGPGRPLTPA